MIIGARVAERMAAESLSQAELARRVGISQQAVGKLIHGNSRKTTHIVRLARELATTPAYLEGDTDDPKGEASAPATLDSETRELNECFAEMQKDDRRALLRIVRTMRGKSIGDLEPGRGNGRARALPREPALAQMFEGLLEGISPSTSLIERAQLLAKRLPIGLSQLHDVHSAPETSQPAEAGRKARAAPAKRHRVPQS